MRKLPVFFAIDVSESMAGPSHDAVSDGLLEIVAALRSDPHALETVHLSVIVFAGRARVLVPMTDLMSFYAPELPKGGGTSLGSAIEALMGEIDRTVVRGTAARKGDWKPIIFLMTDGHPTDDPRVALARWRQDYAARATMVAVSVGGGADHRLLREIADETIVLGDAGPESFRRFLRWMSDSIQTRSRAINDRAPPDRVDLSKDLPAGAHRLDEGEPDRAIDDRLAVFIARCQHSEAPYLMRFERASIKLPVRYVLRQTLPLKTSYFDLCAPGAAKGPALSTDSLEGRPSCPHCGSAIGMVACPCGGLHCIDGPGLAICPWCGNQGDFQPAPHGAHIDVVRGIG